jgi:trigger factor
VSQSASTEQTVQVKVTEKPACRIELDVIAPPEMVQNAQKLAIKSVSKEISLPGFRKGKAPEAMILKKFPADVERKLQKELADLAFVTAQKTAKIPVLNNNSPISFDSKKISLEDGAELVFSFETEPKIPEIDASKFSEKPLTKPEVADKQIDEAIRQMRFFYAQWTPVQDRPIQDGDYIMIDLDTVENDETQRVFNHIRFEVTKDKMADWMKKLVEGAKSGDVLNGVSEPDTTATEAEKAEFKPKNVRITILKVEEATLPELDDAFAKKVGATDPAHMRQAITDLLNKQADDKVQNDLRDQVNDFLIANYTFELPQSLIETEKKHRFNQMMHDPKFKAGWNKMSQEDRKSLEEKTALEANEAVRIFYLSRQIVKSNNIAVTHQEVQTEAISIYQSHAGGNVEADQMPKEIFALALSKVILTKAQDHILKKA